MRDDGVRDEPGPALRPLGPWRLPGGGRAGRRVGEVCFSRADDEIVSGARLDHVGDERLPLDGPTRLWVPEDLVTQLGLRERGRVFLVSEDGRREERRCASPITARTASSDRRAAPSASAT